MPSNIPDVSSESTPRTVYHISHIKSRDVNKLKGQNRKCKKCKRLNKSSKKIDEIQNPDKKRNVVFTTFQKELTKKSQDLNSLVDSPVKANQAELSQGEHKENFDQLAPEKQGGNDDEFIQREDSFSKSGLNAIRLMLSRKSMMLSHEKHDSEIAKLIKNMQESDLVENKNNEIKRINLDASAFKVQAEPENNEDVRHQVLNEENSIDFNEEGSESEVDEDQFNLLGDTSNVLSKSKEYTNEAILNLEK